MERSGESSTLRAAFFGTDVLTKRSRGELMGVSLMIERTLRWLMSEPTDLNVEVGPQLIKSVGLSDYAHEQASRYLEELSPLWRIERCALSLSRLELSMCLESALSLIHI